MAFNFAKSTFSAFLFVGGSLFGGSVVALAQETASIPATIPVQPTLSQCEVGAGAAGTCVNPTQGYMNALIAQALPAEQFSQTLADYVIALSAISQANEACNPVDIEIAQAIKLVSSYALDSDQRLSLATIGETIGSCEDFQTAAIAPAASPN